MVTSASSALVRPRNGPPEAVSTMRLTQFSDYALRTLLYLGVHDDQAVPLAEVARSYGISYHHLVKVAGMLAELGLVTSVRGRTGGYRLAVTPAEINIGALIRSTARSLSTA